MDERSTKGSQCLREGKTGEEHDQPTILDAWTRSHIEMGDLRGLQEVAWGRTRLLLGRFESTYGRLKAANEVEISPGVVTFALLEQSRKGEAQKEQITSQLDCTDEDTLYEQMDKGKTTRRTGEEKEGG